MANGFYARLAFNNLKNNRKMYLPYILTCIITVMMFYMIHSLNTNESIASMRGGNTIQYALSLGAVIVGIFAVIFLFYTNSFIIKRRQKEFGLYNVLGMEKRHLGIVLFFETLFIGLLSIVLGIALGILFDKLLYLIIARILNADYGVGFFISWKTIVTTFVLFVAIFTAVYLFALIRVKTAQPIELLKGASVGEKEPKTRRVMAILGLICLIAGYALSILTKDAGAAIELFFVAVILVILGTYFLFTAGSIALLKLLKKKKKYYYKANHFTSVSGMTYRMKQNSVGLASICILATMLLVTISVTSSFIFAKNEMIEQKYPYDLIVQANASESANDELTADIRSEIDKFGMSSDDEIICEYLPIAAFLNGNKIDINKKSNESPILVLIVTLDTYNNISGQHKKLGNNEIIISENNTKYEHSTANLFDKEFFVKEKVENFVKNGFLANDVASAVTGGLYIIVPDDAMLKEIHEKYITENGAIAISIQFSYGANLSGDKDTQLAFYDAFKTRLQEKNYNARFVLRAEQDESFMGLYGGAFFLGIYLGLLFLMGAILIIYYKQISEGFEDKKRFEIMQKVGMSYAEVKKSINSQILTVFFLPLIVAGIHVAFSFPMIIRMMSVLAFTNVKLFAICSLGCFAAFSVIYVIVYLLTAKVYYRIVKSEQ